MRLALILLLAGLPSCTVFLTGPDYPPPAPPEVLDREFTPEELRADLDELFTVLEDVHPDLYAVLPREEAARRRAELAAGLDHPMKRVEFWPRVAELVAALGDGHTALHMPMDEFWRGPAAACFPVDVAWDGAALRVRRTAVVTEDGRLGPGARVVSISGRPADELFRRFLSLQSGESEAYRASGVEHAFPLHLWIEGVQPPWRLLVEPVEGERFSVNLSGMSWNVVQRGAAGSGPTRLTVERRADGVAVMSVDTLGLDLGDFEDWLEGHFEKLHEQPPAALVVDLRRNGGGNSMLGDELLEYVAHAPWRQAARKDWKMSDRYRDWFKTYLTPWLRWLPVQYLHPMGWKMWTADDGEIVSFEEELIEPRDEPLRYDGPVAFLIGPGTFSSAASLACAVKDFRLALLVGEETGGPASGFGEVMPFQLANTRLGGQVSSARDVRGSGDATSTGGVEPDVLVRAEPGATGDPVLEAAVQRLLSPVARP